MIELFFAKIVNASWLHHRFLKGLQIRLCGYIRFESEGVKWKKTYYNIITDNQIKLISTEKQLVKHNFENWMYQNICTG